MIEGLLLSLIIYSSLCFNKAWIFILLLSFVYLVRYRKRIIALVFICLITTLLLFRVGTLQLEEFTSYSFPLDKVRAITGVVREDSRIGSWGQKRCVIKLYECNLSNGDVATAKGRINVTYTGSPLYYGDIVTFSGKLTDKDFKAKDYKLVNRSSLNRTRSRFISFISSKINNDLSMMLILGITPNIDSEISLLARNSGNSHILALSGMHLSLFSAILVFILKPIFTKRYAKLISLSILTLYILMIGPKPSLIRAYILSFVFTAFKLEKPIDYLVICFTIQVLLFKDSIMTLSTLLSYVSLCGIMTVPELLLNSIDEFIVIPKLFITPFLVTIGALLFTIPISFNFFGSYQLSSILTSFIAGIVVYIYMLLCILNIFSSKLKYMLDKVYTILVFILEKGSYFKLQENLNAYYTLVISTLAIILIARLKRLCK